MDPNDPADKRKIEAHTRLEAASRQVGRLVLALSSKRGLIYIYMRTLQLAALEEEQTKIELQRRIHAAGLPGEYLTNPAKKFDDVLSLTLCCSQSN